ncbi:hypothetical protein DFH06DRAFT_1220966 [Mycena polygramma]|nr:hypothetical protein DFH06DRAFT_1220966 [Mycena polygramma]
MSTHRAGRSFRAHHYLRRCAPRGAPGFRRRSRRCGWRGLSPSSRSAFGYTRIDTRRRFSSGAVGVDVRLAGRALCTIGIILRIGWNGGLALSAGRRRSLFTLFSVAVLYLASFTRMPILLERTSARLCQFAAFPNSKHLYLFARGLVLSFPLPLSIPVILIS